MEGLPLILCNHHAKFHGRSYCGSRDVMYLICHVALQDHVIKGSFDFMEGNFSLYVTALPSLVSTSIVVMEICF